MKDKKKLEQEYKEQIRFIEEKEKKEKEKYLKELQEEEKTKKNQK